MLLRERKVIVTGGPTREWLDPVRFISNPSSGKMGLAIADEGFKRSRETVFIHGPIEQLLLSSKRYRCVPVETTADMLSAVKKEIVLNSVLIMAAAPADYSPVKRSAQKIKKSGERISIEFNKTPDILKEIAAMKRKRLIQNMFTVGFAAETNNLEEYALKKLREKDLDMICLNDVSRSGAGFGTDTNIITIFMKNGSRIELPMISKQEIAVRLLDEIEIRLPKYLT
jgi:phosphopantothenoylcysteine decarboxylase / phosphopantothenate---cysteine ligase